MIPFRNRLQHRGVLFGENREISVRAPHRDRRLVAVAIGAASPLISCWGSRHRIEPALGGWQGHSLDLIQ
jgi:hypothetical protein